MKMISEQQKRAQRKFASMAKRMQKAQIAFDNMPPEVRAAKNELCLRQTGVTLDRAMELANKGLSQLKQKAKGF